MYRRLHGEFAFVVGAKYLEFIIKRGGNSFKLRIVEQGKGYIQSIVLGKDGAFWLSTLDEVARVEICGGFV